MNASVQLLTTFRDAIREWRRLAELLYPEHPRLVNHRERQYDGVDAKVRRQLTECGDIDAEARQELARQARPVLASIDGTGKQAASLLAAMGLDCKPLLQFLRSESIPLSHLVESVLEEGILRGEMQQQPKGKQKTSLDARAVAIFMENQSLTKTEIAKMLGVKIQSLAPNRCKRLDAALRAVRESGTGRRIRGYKGKDGSIEAYEDDE